MRYGSVTPRVTVDVLWFGALAAATVVICELVEHVFGHGRVEQRDADIHPEGSGLGLVHVRFFACGANSFTTRS